MRSADESIVRLGALIVSRIMSMAACFNVPAGYKTVLTFTATNMHHLFTMKELDPQWKKMTIKDMHQVNALSSLMLQLTWAVLTLGKMINTYRSNAAMTPINWIDAATDYDKKRTANATKPDVAEAEIIGTADSA